MPLNPITITAAINANMLSKGLLGKNSRDIASAIGNAVGSLLLIPNVVTCVVSGTAGPSGVISSLSVLGVSPKLMSSLMFTRGLSKGFTGKNSLDLYNAISAGVAQALFSLYLTGTVLGCGIGTGIGKFVNISEKLLSSRISSEMLFRAMLGTQVGTMSDIIAYGIVTHLKTSVSISVSVLGAVAPIPPVGPVPVAGIPSVTTQIV